VNPLLDNVTMFPISPYDVRAVVYDNGKNGGANRKPTFDTGYKDLATMCREYPISIIEGSVDTLLYQVDASHRTHATIVFYNAKGKEIPDPRTHLEYLDVM